MFKFLLSVVVVVFLLIVFSRVVDIRGSRGVLCFSLREEVREVLMPGSRGAPEGGGGRSRAAELRAGKEKEESEDGVRHLPSRSVRPEVTKQGSLPEEKEVPVRGDEDPIGEIIRRKF